MQLENHIAHLLKQHNCVIVPEFGGFIANYESAWINHARAVIYPPYKQVLFNRSLTQNDGLLANELMQSEKISYADALARIAAAVKFWRTHLEAGERIELNEIGFLFLQNGQVVFEQNREVNLLLQAYGLKQVTFVDYSVTKAAQTSTSVVVPKNEPVKTIAAKQHKESVKQIATSVGMTKPTTNVGGKQPATSVVENVKGKQTPVIALNTDEQIESVETAQDNPQIIPITRKRSRNYKYAVAAAVILPTLFYAYWIPMKTDFLNTGKVQMSDFNPFGEQAKSVYQQRETTFNIDASSDWKSWEELTGTLPAHVAVYNLELTEELYIPVQLERAEENSNTFNPDGSFHVIAGCFSVEANAGNLTEQLTEKGYPAGIVDKHKGLFRVSAGAFNSEKEAELALDQFKNEGFSGWILKK